MAVTIKKFSNSTYLDEIGYRVGLFRFKDEALDDFHLRILKQQRNHPEQEREYFYKSLGWLTKEQDINPFKIALNANSVDPRIQITSSFLRVWSDYTNGTLALELNLIDDYRFLENVYDQINALNFLDISVQTVKDGWEYLKSKNLMIFDSIGIENDFELVNSNHNQLFHKQLRTINIMGGNLRVERETLDEFQIDGDYLLNKEEGVLISRIPARGVCSYTYNRFPLDLKWLPIKAYPLNDEDVDYIIKDDLKKDGVQKRVLLNQKGARVFNKILNQHNNQWGQ